MTNHITRCYEAIVDRCRVAGLSTNEDMIGCKPTFIWPYLDYMRFGEKIDEICGNFVCQTNSDANGSFDTFFSTLNSQTTNYPMDFPMWTVSNLHVTAGITNWSTNEASTIWMACDRGIQERVSRALNLLIWTKQGACVDNNLGDHPDTRGIWSWDGYGVSEAKANVSKGAGFGDWPEAWFDYAKKPVGIENPPAWSCNFVYDPSGATGSNIDLWCNVTSFSRPDWVYKLSITVSGAASVGPNQYGYIDLDGVGRDFLDADSFSITTTNNYSFGSHARFVAYLLYGDASLTSVKYVDAYCRAGRENSTIAVKGVDTNYPSGRDLYLIGNDYSWLGGWVLTNSAEYTGRAEWSPEISPLYTNKYACIYTVTSTDSNAWYEGSIRTDMPGDESSVQRYYAVKNGNWLLRWQLPSVPGPEPVEQRDEPDSDQDDLVETGADLTDFGPDTGTIFFDAVCSDPIVIVPLARTPVWYAGVPVSAYLAQGAFHHLPYQYLPVPSDAFAGWLPDGADDTANLDIDDTGYYQALSINTRILESNYTTNSSQHIKRVALMRPKGNVVVFDFPWTNNAFSVYGYPIGVNSGRTYVMVDITPGDHRDRRYDLRFQSGVVHRFGRSLSLKKRTSESGYMVTPLPDFYKSGWLESVSHVDGRSSSLKANIAFDMWLNRETTTLFPGGLFSWQYSTMAMDFNERTIAEGARDAKYEVSWQRQKGHITSVNYKSRSGPDSITTVLSYDQNGKITGLNKSGIPGIAEKGGVTVSPDGSFLTYCWGTVKRAQTGQSGNTRTVTITEKKDSRNPVVCEVDLDPADRIRETRLTVGDDTARTVFSYGSGTGRYANGVQKASKIAGIEFPDKSSVTLEYDPVSGWLKSERQPVGNGLVSISEYFYAPNVNTDFINPTNLVERPRKVQQKVGDVLVGAVLYSYSGASQTIIQQCTNSSPAWDAPGNLVTVATYKNSSDASWHSEDFRNIHNGQLSCLSYPGGESYFTYSETNGFRRIEAEHSAGYGSIVTNNAFGHTQYALSTEDRQTTSVVRCSADSFGRIVRTTNLDGSFTENRNYGYFGPADLLGVDGSLSSCQYYDFGPLKSVNSPAIGVQVSDEYDVLGNSTRTVETADGRDRIVSATFDVLGRVTSRTTSFGTTTFTYSQTTTGTRRITTFPDRTTLVEDFYFDGSLLEIQGSAASAHLKYEYGVDAEGLYTKEIRVADDGGTLEFTKTYQNMLGAVSKSVMPKFGGGLMSSQNLFDQYGRFSGSIDPTGIKNLTQYNSKNLVSDSGMKVGAGSQLVPAGNDRYRSYTRSVSPSEVTSRAAVYPASNDGSSTVLSSSVSAHDGKSSASTCAGRTSSWTRGDYGMSGSDGGCYSETNRNSNGTWSVTEYRKWRLDKVTRYNKENQLVETVSYQYNGFGELTQVNNSRSGSTTYTRDDNTGLVTKVTPSDLSRGVTTYEYYPNTARIKVFTSKGSAIRYEYYDNGLLKREYDTGTYDVSYTYDSQGRKRTMTTAGSAGTSVTEWVYEANTGLLKYKKINNVIVEDFDYRDDGQVASVKDAEGVVLANNYDNATGDLLGMTASGGSGPAVSYSVDRMGRVTGTSISGGISESSAYTIDGFVLTNAVLGNGIVSNAVIERKYDSQSAEVTSMVYRITGVASGAVAVAYNADGNVTTVSNGATVAEYFYTNSSFVSSVTISCGGTGILTRCNDWDMTNSRPRSIFFRTADGTNVSGFIYNYETNSDRIAQTTLLDGSFWRYYYDLKGQLLFGRKYNPDSSETPGLQYGYEYDGIGNMTKSGPLGAGGGPVYSFTADIFNFYTTRTWGTNVSIVGEAGSDVRVTINGVSAQKNGGRFCATVPVNNLACAVQTNMTFVALKTNALNETLWMGTGSLYVAKCSEAVSNRLTGVISQDSRFRCSWNSFGQLTNVVSLNAAPNFQLVFDYYPDGRRASKKVYRWSGSAWTLFRAHQFHYDNWNLISESVVCGPSSIVYSYTWGLDLSGQRSGKYGESAGGIGGLLAITVTSNGTEKVYLPISDHNGNIQHLLQISGSSPQPSVVASYEYSPFGALVGFRSQVPGFSPTDICPFLFQTKYYDAETELYYFGYRYYDPNSCKWLSRDPKGEAGGINLSCFCLNDPVNNVDPDGRDVFMVYRAFDDKILKYFWSKWKWLPIHLIGHVYLVFTDDNMGTDVQKEEWHQLLQKDGYARAKAHSYSFHPKAVADEMKGLPKTGNLVGTFLTDGSVIIADADSDVRAYQTGMFQERPVTKRLVTRNRGEQLAIYQEVRNSILHEQTNYAVSWKNCANWVKRMINGSKVHLPSGTRLANLGAGSGGLADVTGLSVGTYGVVKGGYMTVGVMGETVNAMNETAKWAGEHGVSVEPNIGREEDSLIKLNILQFNY